MTQDILEKAKDLENKIKKLEMIENDDKIFPRLRFFYLRNFGDYDDPIYIPSELYDEIFDLISKWKENFKKELKEL